MKNYYLIIVEHLIGIIYLLLFLIGFFTNNKDFYHIGGIGMLFFMLILIKGQPKNLSSFLFVCGIGGIIAYFFSKWWIGLFWVSSFFTIGQIFGLIALIKKKEQIKNMNLVNFAMSGMKTKTDKISLIEFIFFVGLLIGPYLLAGNLNEENSSSNSIDKEIKKQLVHMEKSIEYNNEGIKIMNLNDSMIVSQNKIDAYKEILKKSIIEARKVDTAVLNKVKKGWGTVFYEKYIIGKELELKGYETGDASSSVKGQILYDEFLNWMKVNKPKSE